MSNRIRVEIKLQDCWLYAVASKTDLARRLSTEKAKVTVDDLERLAIDAGNFRLFTIQSNNKERAVQEPKPDLQRLHIRIHKLLSRVEVPEYLHSTVKKRSYLTNARSHDLDASTIKIDVKKFFPSVSRKVIFRFFLNVMKCRSDVAGLLADITTFDSRLPTGSSSSPIIAYYAFKEMFDEISLMAEEYGLKMTCYVDDITLSGANATGAVLYKMHQIIAKYGLKSHKMKLFSPRQAKIITGVCNIPGGERIPNKLHLKISTGFAELNRATSPEAKEKIARPLLGRLEAARQIDPSFGARARTLRSKLSRSKPKASQSNLA